jgi:proline racemase
MQFTRMINAVETHSGIPMRVITGGVPTIPGETVYQQMRWLERNDGQLRLLMLREPRGYPAACCNLIVPAKHPQSNGLSQDLERPRPLETTSLTGPACR